MNLGRIILAALVLAASAATAERAGAQVPPSPGWINANALRPVPPRLALAVLPEDDSPDNVALAREIAQLLARRGASPGARNSPFVLYFSTEVHGLDRRSFPGGPFEPDRDRAVGPVEGGTARVPGLGRGSVESEFAVIAPLGRPPGPSAPRYTLRASLEERAGGARLWEGEASHAGAIGDSDAATFSALARALAAEFGNTVRMRRFALD